MYVRVVFGSLFLSFKQFITFIFQLLMVANINFVNPFNKKAFLNARQEKINVYCKTEFFNSVLIFSGEKNNKSNYFKSEEILIL